MKPIWYPLAAVIWLSVVIFVLYRNWGWWNDRIMSFWENLLLGGGIGGLVLVVFGGALVGCAVGLSALIDSNADHVWHECWRGPLVALRNSDGISGHISGGVFVLSGQIESREVYYYYTADGPDRYKPHHWKVDGDTTVIEENRSDGEVVEFDSAFENPLLYWFAEPNDRLRMDFHIPKGSLVHQFSVK